MATLNLGNYIPSSASTSVIGYCTSASGSYSLWAKGSIGTGATTVATITKGTGSAAHEVSLGGADFSKGNLTEINAGSSSDAWSIVGDQPEYATVTKIVTGSGNDIVSMNTLKDGAEITTGAGTDSVSVGTASGSLTVNLNDGADVFYVQSALGALTVNAGNGANGVSIHSAQNTFTYNGGDDADVVSLGSVEKSATITLGNGANVVSVGKADSNLTINGGDGVDSVVVSSVTGGATINLGEGNNLVSVTKSEGELQITAGSGKDSISIGTVGSNATIALGEGADTVKIADKVEGLLTITGDGENGKYISVGSTQIDKGVNIALASGKDTLIIDQVAVNDAIGGTISLGDGKDEVSISALEKATVTGGAGDKTVSLGTVISGSVALGNGKDTVEITKVDSSTIELGDGRDVLYVKSALGSTINLGSDNDFISLGGTSTKLDSTTINTGDGKDTVYIAGGTKVADVTIAGGAGADVVSLANNIDGTVTLGDFEVGTDTLYAGIGSSTDVDFTSDGVVSVKGGTKVKVNGSGSYAATVAIGSEVFNVAWTGENATTLDASSFTKKAVLIGDNNDDTSDTLIGGAKDDTIFAGKNDYVYGGAGNDSIVVNSGTDTTYVGFTKTGGKDVVSGFSSDDVVYLFENSISDISKITYSNSDTTLKMGTATLNLGNATKFGVRDSSGSDYELQVVTGSTTVAGADSMAGIYYAADNLKGSLDFSKVNDRLVVDLGNTGLYANTNNAVYLGKFESVKGGSDDTILMGAGNQSETLMAGTGATTIWGGGSKSDVMVHNGSDNAVMYVFGEGDGKDVISSNNWGSKETSDVLWLNGGTISSIRADGSDTTIALTSGDKVTLKGKTDVNTAIKYTTDAGATVSMAKIGKGGAANNFTYVEEVSAYIGGSGNTLTVGSDVDTANIWLDGSQGKSFEGVKVVDARSSAGDLVIAGVGTANESLVASKGSTSLWGGAGSSNDTLTGTTGGTATYFFGNGDGKDVITGSHSDDLVNLYNVGLSDVADIKTTSTSMEITLNDGSSLTINNMSSTSVKTFKLADNSTWEYNTSTKEWSQA